MASNPMDPPASRSALSARQSRWTTLRRGLTVAVVTLLLVSAPGLAYAAASDTIKPVQGCRDLIRSFDLPGAATKVTAADVVTPEGEPEHCAVTGQVAPRITFDLKLPTETYTGRYLQHGCGGICGGVFAPTFPDCGEFGGDAAVAATDDGHQSAPFDGSWAAGDQAARDDWFFRAPHVVSRASKAIIAAFYGAPPEHSYFSGCSGGGREALLLAQRYPHDFDGIIASAPAAYMGPLFGMSFSWNARAAAGPDGAPVITADKLPGLHQAVLRACDGLDGLTDGQLDEPRACRFDPATLSCPDGTDTPDCLTPAQVRAARKLYAGPADADGRRLYPAGQAYGSELFWADFVNPLPGFGGSVSGLFADTYLRHIGYPMGSPHSSLADIRHTVKELHRLTAEGRKGNSLKLDLREFRRSGGKLILWHGWADPAIAPAGTVDYYQRLTERSGGPAATRSWARLFMVPTMHHCAGGSRLTEFDPFQELMGWAERGHAPDKVIATGRSGDGPVTRTRPVFPYPLRAAYDGSGDIDDAANFRPAAPLRPTRDAVPWAGDHLYAIPGPAAG